MEVQTVTLILVMLVALALVFDFMNGFHDAANSIATVVSTGVLKPYQAVVWAAFFNFIAIVLVEMKVAATVGKGIVSPDAVTNQVIFGALVGAIVWNAITWWYGLPSSSSHALIGGLIGATMAQAGTGPLLAPGITKTTAFIVVAPMLGTLGLSPEAAMLAGASGSVIIKYVNSSYFWVCTSLTKLDVADGILSYGGATFVGGLGSFLAVYVMWAVGLI